ncbi:hypothetical protein DL93DRAFT_2081764 [Clavulina sp. PMI_390]|nr:hypothetical protein DL93DRAFT_2081764 [Clavulina sp. PMI_390]
MHQPELIVEILCESSISFTDIVRFRAVCRVWRDTISYSIVLQYLVFLGIYQKVETKRDLAAVKLGIPVLQKLRALLIHEDAWSKLKWQHFRTLSLINRVESVKIARDGFLSIVSPNIGTRRDGEKPMILTRYSLPSAFTSSDLREIFHESYDSAYYRGKNVFNDHVIPHDFHAGANHDITIWSHCFERPHGLLLEFYLRREAEPVETPIVVSTLDLLATHPRRKLMIETTLSGQYLLAVICARNGVGISPKWTHGFVWNVLSRELISHLSRRGQPNIRWIIPDIFAIEGCQETTPLMEYFEIYCPPKRNALLAAKQPPQATLVRRLMLPPFHHGLKSDNEAVSFSFSSDSVSWGAQTPVFPTFTSNLPRDTISPLFADDDSRGELCTFSAWMDVQPDASHPRLEEHMLMFVIQTTTLLAEYPQIDVPWEMWGASKAACVYGKSLLAADDGICVAFGTRVAMLVQDEPHVVDNSRLIGWTIHVLDFNPVSVRRSGDAQAWPPQTGAAAIGILVQDKSEARPGLSHELGGRSVDYTTSNPVLRTGPFQLSAHDRLPKLPVFVTSPLQANLPFISSELKFQAGARSARIHADSERLVIERRVKREGENWKRVLDILTF